MTVISFGTVTLDSGPDYHEIWQARSIHSTFGDLRTEIESDIITIRLLTYFILPPKAKTNLNAVFVCMIRAPISLPACMRSVCRVTSDCPRQLWVAPKLATFNTSLYLSPRIVDYYRQQRGDYIEGSEMTPLTAELTEYMCRLGITSDHRTRQ